MKVLSLTGNPFSKVLNNGKTHEAIFDAFNKEELCQLYVRPVPVSFVDRDFCNSYYMVSDFDVVNRLLLKSKKCGKVVTGENADQETSESYSKFSRKGDKIKNTLRCLRDIIWATNVWKTKELINWLKKENPSLIFLNGGGDSYIYKIALFVRSVTGAEIITYYTDDYFFSKKNISFLDELKRKRLIRCLRNIERVTVGRYAVGEKMATVYSAFFNKPFGFIMNAAYVVPFVSRTCKSTLRLRYFGSLSLGRDKMIMSLAKRISEYFKIDVFTFSDYSDEFKRQLEALDGGVYQGVKDKEYDEKLYSSDALLHIESDDPQFMAITSFAVSTKIPDYLMHGRLIIGYGPSELASMKLLSDNNIGIVLEPNLDDVKLIKNMQELVKKEVLQKYGEKSYKYAINNYDRRKNSLKLRMEFEKFL